MTRALFFFASPGVQVVADLVPKVAQQPKNIPCATTYEQTLATLRDLEDKVCYYLLPKVAGWLRSIR